MSAKLRKQARQLISEQPLTLKELAEKMGLREKRVFRILRSLFEKGEITSFKDWDNQRCYIRMPSYIRAPRKREKEKQASISIPSHVRKEVWRRDKGRCVKCGSRKNLEFDHIIPISKGGSNTTRNIELLCESCNRKKYNKIE